MLKIIKFYGIITGLLFVMMFVGLLVLKPSIVKSLYYKVYSIYFSKKTTDDYSKQIGEKEHSYPKWSPLPRTSYKKGTIYLNSAEQPDLHSALNKLQEGDSIIFGEGSYSTPIFIEKNNVTIVGDGHVQFKYGIYDNKGFIVNTSNNLTIRNIECLGIRVKDQNGACLRHEGHDLTLEHVYFHDSESGILETSNQRHNVYIKNSRFENIGKNGLAHSIYLNSADLYLDNTLILNAKDESHSLKTRGQATYILNSTISSHYSNNSRAIDLPNGGFLSIEGSTIHKGPLSVNFAAIGFGHEGIKHEKNELLINNNLILLERVAQNGLIDSAIANFKLIVRDNLIIGKVKDNNKYPLNQIFESRNDAKIKPYPHLPFKQN